MDNEEISPSGCWSVLLSLLLSLPAQLLVRWLANPWQAFITPRLQVHLSADAVTTIYGFSLVVIMLAVWMATLKFVDLLFGTELLHFDSDGNVLSPGERAQLHRRGLMIMAAVIAADQAAKFAFGVYRPTFTSTPALAPDAAAIVNSLAVLLFVFYWWRTQDKLQSLAISLMLGGIASASLSHLLRNGTQALSVHAFGMLVDIAVAHIAGLIGLFLFAISWFWDRDDSDHESTPQPER